MPSPSRNARTLPSPTTSPLAGIETSLVALLTAIEPHEPDAPAAKAFRAAMRARGQEATAAGGGEALDYLLARVRDDDPGKADVREAIIEVSWAGLPGWRS